MNIMVETHVDIDNIMKISPVKAIRHRLPWLLIGLVGGILASRIIYSFEKTLSTNLALAAYIPLIVYMSDAIGTQMESFVIRDLALHNRMHIIKYLLRQLAITTLLGTLLAMILLVFATFFHQDIKLSATLSISLLVSIISSVFTGVGLPLFFRKINLDPANASGPVATIIQDLLSVTIYFTVASALL